MTGVEGKTIDGDTLHDFLLEQLYLIPIIYFSAGIIGKTRQNLNFMASAYQFLCEGKAEKEIRFRLKIMSNKEYFH